MSTPLKDHRLPIVLSVAALAIATLIGLVPVMQQGGSAAQPTSGDAAALEARIADLEAMLAAGSAGTDTDAAEIPADMTNARLRQEIDLINRGLGNQTGRISRLKAVVENNTGLNGEVAIPALVTDEIALAKRGLANLTRRINALEDSVETLATASADITRLQQQMANVDRAFLRQSRNTRDARDERMAINAALENALNAGASGTGGGDADYAKIQATLNDILTVLNEQ